MAFSETQAKALRAKLGARHVRTRNAAGTTLSYIEGWHAIAEANRIFGFEGWDRETIEARCVSHGANRGRHSCTYLARVRIRVRAGDDIVTREGSGAGEWRGESASEAHEYAFKTAETDATKRALATFGNAFGLALYDPERRGVRQARSAKPADTVAVTWQLSGTAPPQIFEDPVDYYAAFRRELAAQTTSDAAGEFYRQNQESLKRLKSAAPELVDDLGRHYSEIIEKLCADHLRTLDDESGGIPQSNRAKHEGAIDKSVLSLGVPRRIRDKAHLKTIASHPCLVCGRRPSQAHHLAFMQPRALGAKVSDEWTVPRCLLHHRDLHDCGDEQVWWRGKKIGPEPTARELWQGRLNGHRYDGEGASDATNPSNS